MGFHVPSRIDSAYFPGADFRRGRKTQAEVFAHRTWSVPAADLRGPLELSSAMHFTERECAPQTLSSPAAPNHDNLPPGRKTHIHTHAPVRRPYRRRPHLLNYQLNILFKSRENHTPHCRSGRHGCQVPDWIPDCRKNKDTSVRRPERTAKEHGQTSCYG